MTIEFHTFFLSLISGCLYFRWIFTHANKCPKNFAHFFLEVKQNKTKQNKIQKYLTLERVSVQNLSKNYLFCMSCLS